MFSFPLYKNIFFSSNIFWLQFCRPLPSSKLIPPPLPSRSSFFCLSLENSRLPCLLQHTSAKITFVLYVSKGIVCSSLTAFTVSSQKIIQGAHIIKWPHFRFINYLNIFLHSCCLHFSVEISFMNTFFFSFFKVLVSDFTLGLCLLITQTVLGVIFLSLSVP